MMMYFHFICTLLINICANACALLMPESLARCASIRRFARRAPHRTVCYLAESLVVSPALTLYSSTRRTRRQREFQQQHQLNRSGLAQRAYREEDCRRGSLQLLFPHFFPLTLPVKRPAIRFVRRVDQRHTMHNAGTSDEHTHTQTTRALGPSD